MPPDDVGQVVRDSLVDLGVEWEEPQPGTFVVVLPGEHKLRTTVSMVLGPHRLTVNAFVVRRPDENHEEVWRWLLRANIRHPGLAFGIDQSGDVYLAAELAREAVSAAEVDLLLGRVLATADGAFDTLLELGFASSIRREWAWRHARGEPTANLEAFRHLDPTRGDGR
jgi:hypothetical protein